MSNFGNISNLLRPLQAEAYNCWYHVQKRILNPSLLWDEIWGNKRRSALYGLLIYWGFCLPSELFKDPVSTVLLSREGKLLGAKIADDGQWRFPENDSIPDKFVKCVMAFEDQRFYYHPGFDPLSMMRATAQNVRSGKVVSGGSTLTMQTIRLSRKGQRRSYFEKVIELFQATRLELRCSKAEILALYASHAPFGGNVVGLDAAAWKYYARPANTLGWAEMAALAVLPNAPRLVHPGRGRQVLLRKRNFVLDRLLHKGQIDTLTCELAKQEPLPGEPQTLPMLAAHLLERAHREHPARSQARVQTTLEAELQSQVTEVVARHHSQWRENQIHNAAVIVADVLTGEVLAYVGNAPGCGFEHGEDVDIIIAPRSTGSILKPFLYAAALDDGLITPHALLPDVPTQFNGYVPKNFDGSFAGAVPANDALARSLNIPHVSLLQKFGIDKFHSLLKSIGMTTLHRPPGHYGLTLVLGGAESTLWDLAGMYAGMARQVENYPTHQGRYLSDNWRPLNYLQTTQHSAPKLRKNSPLSAGASWHALQAMQELVRPEAEGYWERFADARRISWKTGTSFGFRDAWAVGVTPRHVVAVWVGNASGEARPDLVGIVAAAPLMFEVMNLLPRSRTFDGPFDDMVPLKVCRRSGLPAGQYCTETDTLWSPKASERAPACRYHQPLNLDATGLWRVHDGCESPQLMQQKVFFVLPPSQEYYYKNRQPDLEVPPPYRADCAAGSFVASKRQNLELLYPQQGARLYIPKELNGKRGRAVFQASHRNGATKVFWHLDGVYLGQTEQLHEFAVSPSVGQHVLSVVDAQGETVVRQFEVYE